MPQSALLQCPWPGQPRIAAQIPHWGRQRRLWGMLDLEEWPPRVSTRLATPLHPLQSCMTQANGSRTQGPQPTLQGLDPGLSHCLLWPLDLATCTRGQWLGGGRSDRALRTCCSRSSGLHGGVPDLHHPPQDRTPNHHPGQVRMEVQAPLCLSWTWELHPLQTPQNASPQSWAGFQQGDPRQVGLRL